MLPQFLRNLAFGIVLASISAEATPSARQERCPDYSSFSRSASGKEKSSGPLGLPLMRPAEHCRTFKSLAVETVISDLTKRMKDNDLARLFENTFPNTLDTTIKWTSLKSDVKLKDGDELTFVVTGDIPAEWLRDSSNQFRVYLPLVGKDADLRALTRGVINLQARYITKYPYCNAFQPPPESGLRPQCCSGDTGATIFPPDDSNVVWTCGYETDSLLSFLQLSRIYYQYSKDETFMTSWDSLWFQAIDNIFMVIQQQSTPTFDTDGNIVNFYRISGPNQQYMRNGGRGPPKAEIGLVGTTYRPSDDVVIFPYNIPHQAMLVVELKELANLLSMTKAGQTQKGKDIAKEAKRRAGLIEDAVWKWGVVDSPRWGKVFAYEVDGYGGVVIQDDANVPSLVSIPYLGFTDVNNTVYQNTRKMLLSPRGNPYYGFGTAIKGIGGQHVGEDHVWPMSLVTEVITGTDDKDILEKLEYLKNTTAGLGLIHESVHTHNVNNWSRQWFAWANSYFGEAIIQLAEKKPHLLFEDGKPYKLSELSLVIQH